MCIRDSKAVQAVQESNGLVEQVTESELAEAAAQADLTGMYCCPHTGVAIAVLKKLVDNGTIKKDDRTVVVSTAHGLKFTQFKVGYHESDLDNILSKLPNPPSYVDANTDAVKKAIESRLG